MTAYVALIRKEPETDYGVDFPDFPGCISAGHTLDEALGGAEEALNLHIKGMIEDGELIPDPSPLDKIMAAPENQGAIPALMRINYPKSRAVRVNITIDEPLLADIDAYTAAHNQTRSAFLAHAARKVLLGQ